MIYCKKVAAKVPMTMPTKNASCSPAMECFVDVIIIIVESLLFVNAPEVVRCVVHRKTDVEEEDDGGVTVVGLFT